jgi:catechol 2,3-dioxygenase
VLNVTDLAASRSFYEELIGLVVSDQDADRIYLRGVEETAHHSLVLQRSDQPSAERLGFRVASDQDLEAAHDTFERAGLEFAWVDIDHQGRTLHVCDVAGVPLELCVSMPTRRRLILDDDQHRGAAAARIDHLQVHVTDVPVWVDFHVGLGFRVSEYASASGAPDTPMLGAFLARKGDLLDFVGVTGPGPRLHHVAFVVHNPGITLTRVCDLASARGTRDAVEYGPGRHGLAPQHFLYLRDPDGHRVELVSHGYQLLDPEVEPVGWSIDNPRATTAWGPPPPALWREEAMSFSGVSPTPPPEPAASARTRMLAAGR